MFDPMSVSTGLLNFNSSKLGYIQFLLTTKEFKIERSEPAYIKDMSSLRN